MLKYYRALNDNYGYSYSCDMVRMNYTIASEFYDSFMKLIEQFQYKQNCDVKYFHNSKSIGYADLWTFKVEQDFEKCSFSIGRQLNFLTENKRSGFIEFNPNKCMPFTEFTTFFSHFREFCSSLALVRYDVAIDIPIRRSDVKMIKSSKCNYEYLVECKKESELVNEKKEGLVLNSSVTEYQGRRNHNKYTKLYDKTKESKLDYDLTRIEFTFDRNELEFKNLPQFFIYDPQLCKNLNFGSLSECDMVLVDLLRNSEDKNFYLKRLPFRKRKKIEPFISDATFIPNWDIVKGVRDNALYFET